MSKSRLNKLLQLLLAYIVILVPLVLCGCATSSSTRKDLMDMPNRSNSFLYQGNSITYYESGSGSPILLIHGFGASSYSWRHLTKKFSANHKIITIDLKGFGTSDKPLDDKYQVENQSDIVIALIKQLNIQDITIIGHSFGGAVALFTTIKLTENGNESVVRNLILIDSACYDQSYPYFINILRSPVLNYLSLYLIPNKINTKMLLNKSYHDESKITSDMIDIYSRYLSQPGAYHALIATANQLIPKDIDSITVKYKKIQVPVLTIWGENDEIIPLINGQRLSTDIPHAKLKVISKCGHIPHEECPEETISLIETFLKDQGGM